MKTTTLRRQAGLSLIELMVAITIGLFLMVGLVSVFSTSNQTYMDLGRASQQIENGRFAMQILTDDIAHAGFWGRYSGSPPVPAAADPCVSTDTAAMTAALALHLQGYDAPAAVPVAGCKDAGGNDVSNANNFLAGRDVIVVRRADSTMAAGNALAVPNGALTANGVYIQANADPTGTPIIAFATGVGANDTAIFNLKNKDNTNLAPIRKLHVHIYFVSPCSVPAGGGTVCTGGNDDNGSPIPTLKRIELAANGVMNIVPLVEGIENLQFDYGIDTSKDGVPDAVFLTTPASFADWQNVVAVRINLLSRQIEPSNGYVDSKTYDLGVAGLYTPPAPPALQYKRHAYNAVIRIVNPASRRES